MLNFKKSKSPDNIKTRNRTIRPSSRAVSSKSYKIDTKKVGPNDTLIVNIDHESKPSFFESYTFSGLSVASKNSISFRVIESGNRIDISWSGASPLGLPSRKKPDQLKDWVEESTNKEIFEKKIAEGILQSFDPICNENTKLLILGTMPGTESLEKKQYYANSRNFFWKLLSQVLNLDLSVDYTTRTQQILEKGIGLWDVCMFCSREGSLDANIEDETPNDLTVFVEKNPQIKAIAFNGKEAAKLFGKHFGSIPGIKLLGLPSSSPANAAIPWEEKLSKWSKIKEYLK
ncbi:MAG: DNA-deoxyinosine glycosylase [Bacteroidales bacterium]|nr:DNA-deoxyinosine glycosylase [Bacteroidales bacterium]